MYVVPELANRGPERLLVIKFSSGVLDVRGDRMMMLLRDVMFARDGEKDLQTEVH